MLPDSVATPVLAGPDAGSVDPGVDPAAWPIVSSALEGRAVHVTDLRAEGDAGWAGRPAAPAGGGQPTLTTGDGRALRSLSAVPICGQAGVRGVLVLAHHRARAFSERQLGLVGALVEHLGRALDNGEAAREQARVATALQETLLPPLLPVVPGVDLAARYRPSGSGNLVGGDFYDVFGDGEGGWYVLLGDASGIGPEAAGLAGVARYTARALAETGPGPGEMLAHLNRALLRAAPDDRFCTAVLAHLRPDDTGGLDVTLASAGHPPPFLQRADGSTAPAIGTTGLVLGVLPDAAVGETVPRLVPGEAIVCYTDGVIEAHGHDGQLFGEDRLVRLVSEARGRSAAGIARRIERAVVDYRAPDDHDDLAVVVIRSCPPS
jgi:serine phosphatase RsbU (regulator of sigma subunit)